MIKFSYSDRAFRRLLKRLSDEELINELLFTHVVLNNVHENFLLEDLFFDLEKFYTEEMFNRFRERVESAPLKHLEGGDEKKSS